VPQGFSIGSKTDFPHVRIVLMTAGDRVEAIARMLRVEEYIGKPILPEKLLDILQ